jgi:hypothetical protein
MAAAPVAITGDLDRVLAAFEGQAPEDRVALVVFSEKVRDLEKRLRVCRYEFCFGTAVHIVTPYVVRFT